jgi:hypothetical protein
MALYVVPGNVSDRETLCLSNTPPQLTVKRGKLAKKMSCERSEDEPRRVQSANHP